MFFIFPLYLDQTKRNKVIADISISIDWKSNITGEIVTSVSFYDLTNSYDDFLMDETVSLDEAGEEIMAGQMLIKDSIDTNLEIFKE